jgi:bifunctional non-homologous end joining protein LigD
MAHTRDQSKLPAWIAPQLAVLADTAPVGEDWLHEIKYDGYRLLAWVPAGPQRGSAVDSGAAAGVRLLTRNQKDWTDRFPAIAQALSGLSRALGPAILDGEAAVELASGVTSFQALQNMESPSLRGELQYYLFDAIYLRGEDLTRRPLEERKALLANVLSKLPRVLRYSDHVRGSGPAFHEQACRHGLEGVISKLASAPYQPGRSATWLKVKCVRDREFVVGGFTEPSGSRSGLGALHVGEFDAAGRLVYRGKVGTGFTAAVLGALRRRLEPLTRRSTPFADAPRGAALRETHWVEPQLVVQIRFTDITADGRLRHPSYQGLREDKQASEVVMERPRPRPSVERVAAGRSEDVPARNRNAGSPTEVKGVRLTSPAKVLYPERGLTKLDLAGHYMRVAELMLPHISNRPLTLVRCPAGHDRPCFFQKHMDESAPAAIRRVLVEERDGPEWYGTLNSLEGLVSLVQLGALELHTSNARADRLDRPDRFLIDLDPDEDLGWGDVVEAAIAIRDLLAELGLTSFVKTTGGKGLHIVVPLVRRAGWAEVRTFSLAVASLLAEAAPDRYTTVLSKKRRRGRILLDYLRNSEGATAVEAYSTRARPGAPVAVPIEWSELDDGVRADSYTVETLPARLASLERDPWAELGATKQSLTAAMKRRMGIA